MSEKPLRPASVYLESSTLVSLPFELDSPEFIQVLEYCQWMKIKMFTTKLCVDEFVQHHWEKIQSGIGKIQNGIKDLKKTLENISEDISLRRINLDSDSPIILESLKRRSEEHFASRNISIIPNALIDQDRLIQMAVQKIKPFTAKGEKGFRDTIILETILHHCDQLKPEQLKWLITNDGPIVEALETHTKTAEKKVQALKDITAAKTELDKIVDNKVKGYWATMSKEFLSFIESQKPQLENFIEDKVEFPLDLLKSIAGSDCREVIGISQMKVEIVENIVPPYLKEGLSEAVLPMECICIVKLLVQVHLWPVSKQPTIKVGERIETSERQSVGSSTFLASLLGQAGDETVIPREIHVPLLLKGNVRVTGAGDKYTELTIESASFANVNESSDDSNSDLVE